MSLTYTLDMKALRDLANKGEKALDRALDRIGVEWNATAKETITDMIYTRPRTPEEYRLTGRLRASIVFSSPNSPVTQTERMLDGTVLTENVPRSVKQVAVGSNVEYANAVHNGLEGRTPRPFIIERIDSVMRFARDVIAEELQNP